MHCCVSSDPFIAVDGPILASYAPIVPLSSHGKTSPITIGQRRPSNASLAAATSEPQQQREQIPIKIEDSFSTEVIPDDLSPRFNEACVVFGTRVHIQVLDDDMYVCRFGCFFVLMVTQLA